MNVLIAPDKFKGTLTAAEVCHAIKLGLADSNHGFVVRTLPLADGGEGTLDVFLALGSTKVSLPVNDPLMRPTEASLAISSDSRTAYIEMAQASGLRLLKREEYNPLRTTTFGTGELIRRAIDLGAREILLGIGGSACNDAGIGMMAALGMKFLDDQENELPPNGASLSRIHTVDSTAAHPGLAHVSVVALTDVANPFYGPDGAAVVFGPQKGATPEMIAELDKGLRRVAHFVLEAQHIDLQQIPGAGAGGGIAGGAVAWLNAALKSGIEVVLDAMNFNTAVSWADVVITGEGKLDAQTLRGKVVAGVVQSTISHKKPVVIVCGQQEGQFAWPGVAVFSLAEFVGVRDAMRNSGDALRRLAARRVAAHLSGMKSGE